MKMKGRLMLLVMLVVAIALGAVSYYGIGEDGQMSAAQIKQGLDLSGGVDIVYEADQAAVTEEEMAAAISLLQGRLDWNGWTEAEVAKEGDKRIRVQIPGVENAEEAIKTTQSILSGMNRAGGNDTLSFSRKEAAEFLDVTIDTLRNWELNGLFTAKRGKNGYRIYGTEDLWRLKIIRSLRCANYSLSSILRMLQALSVNPETDIREAIDTPGKDDDIITACDKLLTSLNEAGNHAGFVAGQIEKKKKMRKKNPTLVHQSEINC